MTQETLEKAIELKYELDSTFEILEVMADEKSNWWSFITAKTRADNNGYRLVLTDRLRKKFKETVEELNIELKKEIEAL